MGARDTRSTPFAARGWFKASPSGEPLRYLPGGGSKATGAAPTRRAAGACCERSKVIRLGIDLDGVVADFNGGWITRYNAEFGTDIPLDAVQSWGGMVGLTHFSGMSEFWRWAKGDGSGSLFRHLDTYPDAVPALRKLSRAGHAIVIITTKPQFAVHDTYAWLSEHRIPTREVHITSHKWLVDCDVYLEDAPHNLRRLHAERPGDVVVRFVRAWNEPIDGVPDITDWREFLELVDELADGHTR